MQYSKQKYFSADRKLSSSPNWHGQSYSFTKNYMNRFYEDTTMQRALKTRHDKHYFKEKLSLIEKRTVKLNSEKKKFGVQKKKLLRNLEFIQSNVSLRKQVMSHQEKAAVVIQKHAKGYLVRKKYSSELLSTAKSKLDQNFIFITKKIESMWEAVDKNSISATITIQKFIRGFLARVRYHRALKIRAKESIHKKNKALNVIQSHFMSGLCRVFLRKINQKITQQKLEEIRRRLLILSMKKLWEENKFKHATILKKYNRLDPNIIVDDLNLDQKTTGVNVKKIPSFKNPINYANFYDFKSIVKPKEKFSFTIVTPKRQRTPKPPRDPYSLTTKSSNTQKFQFERSFNSTQNSKCLPKQVNPLANFTKPTQNFIHRTKKSEYSSKKPFSLIKTKPLARIYQRNTKSRDFYMQELKSRAASADIEGKRHRRGYPNISALCPNSLSNYTPVPTPALKTPPPNPLIYKCEEKIPEPEEIPQEKLYLYRPRISMNFQEALPDMYYFVKQFRKDKF